MLASIEATFDDGERVRASLLCSTWRTGVSLCRRYEIERIDGGDLEYMTTELMRGVNLLACMAHACFAVALEPLRRTYRHDHDDSSVSARPGVGTVFASSAVVCRAPTRYCGASPGAIRYSHLVMMRSRRLSGTRAPLPGNGVVEHRTLGADSRRRSSRRGDGR